MIEEGCMQGDLFGNIVRQSSLRPASTLKFTVSGRSTPRNSPTFSRSPSSWTPRREIRSISGSSSLFFKRNGILFWLLLIALWGYIGFHAQTKWAHSDNDGNIFGFSRKTPNDISTSDRNQRRDLISSDRNTEIHVKLEKIKTNFTTIRDISDKNVSNGSSHKKETGRRKKKSGRTSHRKASDKDSVVDGVEGMTMGLVQEEIRKRNTSYGLIVGPFGVMEDRLLEWSPEKRLGTCDRKGGFAHLVRSRKFVLIFHELSITGAPLSMLELATELLSCGAIVSVVILNNKGGLMPEIARRRIKVVADKAHLSFQAAMKADFVIAGSAVCSLWIEQYLLHFTGGSSQIVWWIMENRREYFDRSKHVINQVKILIFISELQSVQWLEWCKEENITLNIRPVIVPLSVNDELAFVAGITCSLNTELYSPKKMLEKRELLRNYVRREMGLTDADMLIISLSSINPAKGQLMLLESVRSVVEQSSSSVYSQKNTVQVNPVKTKMAMGQNSKTLHKQVNHVGDASAISLLPNGSIFKSKETKDRISGSGISFSDVMTPIKDHRKRKLLVGSETTETQVLNVLVGSVGSKSNKMPYLKGLLQFLLQHSNLSKAVLWTPASTRVASLYSAADVYVVNSQGPGETFGRVTIEAMAFGLPVLGTDAGGTKEIVNHNVTGLLHPLGRPGISALSENIHFLLRNPSLRRKMGMRGKKKVEKMYLKKHMYTRFTRLLSKYLPLRTDQVNHFV